MSDRSAPVFVDPTGKRRKSVRTIAIATVGALATVGGLLVAALLGAPIGPTASLPLPPPTTPPVATAPAVPAEPADSSTTTSTDDESSTTVTTTEAASTTSSTSDSAATTTTTAKPGNTAPGRPTARPPKPTK